MSMSVSSILAERHGISVAPGKKGTCPFCEKQTLGVKTDDTVAKCFHPQCGKFLTTGAAGGHVHDGMAEVLQEVFSEFHSRLLALPTEGARNAYTYLLDARQIHPGVVRDSMLGAVPEDYDEVDSSFQPLVDGIKSDVAMERGKPGGARKEIERLEEELVLVEDAREKFIRCIAGCHGWLGFFYTDAHHRIVAVRFRRPYSKDIRYFKPYAHVAGVFGHGLFQPHHEPGMKHLNDLLIVVEGEFNQLQLQSLCARRHEALSKPVTYAYSAAVGGVHNADLATVAKVARSPVVCYDHDMDGAGFQLVDNARQHMTIAACTTPAADSDLDDYIRSYGPDHAAAWEAVQAMLSGRKAYARAYDGVADQVRSVRKSKGKQFEINGRAADVIRADLHDRGRFYQDGVGAYVFLNAERELIGIHEDRLELALLLDRYGINRADAICRYVIEDLHITAFRDGTRTEVHRLAHFDAATCTLYVNNFANQMHRITRDGIELVDNGTDGVLFLADASADPYSVADRANDGASLFDRFIVSRINFVADDTVTPDDRRLLFTLWFLSLFFEAIMPTKPIAAFIGPKGSGKTSALRKVGLLLFAAKFDVTKLTNDARDLEAALTNSAFVVIDNADSDCKWLPDVLATAATGGAVQKRQLYTTNELVGYPIRCFVGITSRTPHFRRDDVADRLLIFKVDRLSQFISEARLLDEVRQHRDDIMTEVLGQLQAVVRALHEHRAMDAEGSMRMADFAEFALKVARHSGVEEQVRRLFEGLSEEQSVFTLEDDCIFDLLKIWAAKNPDREVENKLLCQELGSLATKENVLFPYAGNVRGFAQRMHHLRPNLDQFFTITSRSAGGRRTLWSYRPRRDGE